MIYFFLGIALLALVLYGLNAFSKADPQKLAKRVRILGGAGCLLLALIFALRGAWIFSIPLGSFGLGLLGWNARFANSWSSRSGPSTTMTEDDALEILGLQRGATKAQILKAHKVKMKENHPDHGGSEEEAKKINMAKDFLIGKKF